MCILSFVSLFSYTNICFLFSQTSDEESVECVDIYEQPAFHHDLLKTHKIQVYFKHKLFIILFMHLSYVLIIVLF